MKKLMVGALFSLFAANGMAQTTPTVEVDGKKLQVANMASQGRVQWGGFSQIGNAARNENDGTGNTAAIIKSVGNNADQENKPYAAALCRALKTGGHADWYLPSVNELKGLFSNIKAVGFDEKNTYWSSTEANGTQAVSVYMLNGALYNSGKVENNHYACVRRG